jgi:hypothetical protein
MRFHIGAATATAAALLSLRATPVFHADGPPAAHTGGFAEPTCQECHIGGELNALGGQLGVEGLPAVYEPGLRYRITVVLLSEDMERAGFQAALRFSGGQRHGAQAGRLEPLDGRVMVRPGANGVDYVGHTTEGSELPAPGAPATWSFYWIAPQEEEVVLLHLAANSANGDDSPLGDLIYTAEERISSTSQ